MMFSREKSPSRDDVDIAQSLLSFCIQRQLKPAAISLEMLLEDAKNNGKLGLLEKLVPQLSPGLRALLPTEPVKSHPIVNVPDRKPYDSIQHLVFQGGGVKGIAYIGAIQQLEQKGITRDQIKCVGGASAGAMTALLYGLGFTAEQMKKRILEINFVTDFLLPENQMASFLLKAKEEIPANGFSINDLPHLVSMVRELADRKGLFAGDKIREWLRCMIWEKYKEYGNKKDPTFADLELVPEFKKMYFVGCNLSTCKSEVFSAENEKYLNMEVSKAVRISMSIPLLFYPVHHNGHWFADGGIQDNYPVWLFDDLKYSAETLGFRIVDSNEKLTYTFPNIKLPDKKDSPNLRKRNFLSLIGSVLGCYFDKQESDHHRSNDFSRTVYIDNCGISMVDFDLSVDQQEALIQAGSDAVDDYFNNRNQFAKPSLCSQKIIGVMLKHSKPAPVEKVDRSHVVVCIDLTDCGPEGVLEIFETNVQLLMDGVQGKVFTQEALHQLHKDYAMFTDWGLNINLLDAQENNALHIAIDRLKRKDSTLMKNCLLALVLCGINTKVGALRDAYYQKLIDEAVDRAHTLNPYSQLFT